MTNLIKPNEGLCHRTKEQKISSCLTDFMVSGQKVPSQKVPGQNVHRNLKSNKFTYMPAEVVPIFCVFQ